MQCCPNDITPFTNASSTTIPYAGAYGDTPTVDVMYENEDGTFTKAGVFTLISILPGSIVVDHGGPATGFIKLS